MDAKQHVHKVLKGQRAIVTGAGSGIGAAVARALGAAGASVVVNYPNDRGREPADRIVDAIVSEDGRAIAICADVSEERDVDAMFGRAVDAFGSVDILVNNAGIQIDAPVTEMSLAQWNRVLGVNLTGQFLCAKA